MRVGTLCFTTDQGLGVLAKSFYDHGVVTDVMVVRHGRRTEHPEWYPGAYTIGNLNSPDCRMAMNEFCASMDVMMFFETPFVWELFDHCQACKTKTVLMPMHECMPDPLPATPDLFLCPSLLDWQCCPPHRDCASVFLPVPVDVPWRQRIKAEVFVHNAGNGGLRGRNGTAELIEAVQYVKSDAQIIIYSQVPFEAKIRNSDQRVKLIHGPRKYEDVWRDGGAGDVFVFPEKFNGLSLPLQEARAAGMLVMATDRFPMNTWLPRRSLIPFVESRRARAIPRYREFDEAIVDPIDIAHAIDRWYGEDITGYSLMGKQWAEKNSWAALKPKYLSVLENLVQN